MAPPSVCRARGHAAEAEGDIGDVLHRVDAAHLDEFVVFLLGLGVLEGLDDGFGRHDPLDVDGHDARRALGHHLDQGFAGRRAGLDPRGRSARRRRRTSGERPSRV